MIQKSLVIKNNRTSTDNTVFANIFYEDELCASVYDIEIHIQSSSEGVYNITKLCGTQYISFTIEKDDVGSRVACLGTMVIFPDDMKKAEYVPDSIMLDNTRILYFGGGLPNPLLHKKIHILDVNEISSKSLKRMVGTVSKEKHIHYVGGISNTIDRNEAFKKEDPHSRLTRLKI